MTNTIKHNRDFKKHHLTLLNSKLQNDGAVRQQPTAFLLESKHPLFIHCLISIVVDGAKSDESFIVDYGGASSWRQKMVLMLLLVMTCCDRTRRHGVGSGRLNLLASIIVASLQAICYS